MNSFFYSLWKSKKPAVAALACCLLLPTSQAADYNVISAGTWTGNAASRNATYGTPTPPSAGPGAADNLTLTSTGALSLQNSGATLTGGLNREINNISSTVAGGNIASGGASSGNFTRLTVNGNLTIASSGHSMVFWNTSGAPTTQGAMTVSVLGNISIGNGAALYLGLIEDTGVTNGGNNWGSFLSGFTANSTEAGKGLAEVNGKLMLHRNTTNATFGDLEIGTTGVITLTGAGSANLTHSGTFNKTIQARSISGTGIVENSIILGANGTTSSNATLLLETLATTNATFEGTLRNGSGTGAVLSLSISGSGRQMLSGVNTYSGSTTLNGGTLSIGHVSALGSSTLNQTSGSSLLVLDTTGTISNAMSIHNIQAVQTLTLGGGITVNNATFDVTGNETLTISGGIGGSGGVVKNGSGTLILSGSNSYSGNTTVNNGTLNAAHANALGTNATIHVTGGSLLVTTGGALSGKNITLSSTDNSTAGLAFSGNYNGSIGTLTLQADSIIDLGENNVVAHFAAIANLDQYILKIYNWSGTTLWNGGTGDNPDQIYFASGVSGHLDRISFYSDFGNDFLGNGYQIMGGDFANQVIPVPEPGTWTWAAILLALAGFHLLRRRPKPER